MSSAILSFYFFSSKSADAFPSDRVRWGKIGSQDDKNYFDDNDDDDVDDDDDDARIYTRVDRFDESDVDDGGHCDFGVGKGSRTVFEGQRENETTLNNNNPLSVLLGFDFSH